MNIQKYFDNLFKEIDNNIKIDEEQKEVICDESNHLIVVAGAGAGKTTTLAAKVKYLVDIKKVDPSSILMISLTNKAVDELKERINRDFNIAAKICTFHKLAYDIIKQNDIRYKLNLNSEAILKRIIKNNKQSSKIIKILKSDKVYKRIDKNSLSSLETLTNFTINNIRMIKTLNVDIYNIDIKNKIVSKYVEYLKDILFEYNKIMEDNFELDFEDLIIQASRISPMEVKYKYIIVDEYQDISMNRFILLKKIVEQTNAKTIVVGDDFQTIFSFAGSNINLFLDFQKQMNARLLKITNTYRNSQQLIDIAGNFIMKNSKQIPKELHSNKKCNFPVKIYGYKNDFNEQFENILNKIIITYGDKKSILILGRYNSDLFKITSRQIIIKKDSITFKKRPTTNIKFMTIHASKGLGFDNVIIINFSNEYKGFPSNIKDTQITKYLFKTANTIDEERRLFYVALTRTKNEVYILTKINNESVFIEEIYDNSNVYIDYKFKILKKNFRHKIR